MNTNASGDAFVVSVIVPCYNEEQVIDLTHARLMATLTRLLGDRFEVLYVNDGSGDQTIERLRAHQAADRRVRVINLSRNFGHQFAVSAGLDHAAGDAVVIIDADLQDPPEVIADFLDAWRAGAQVAYGERTDREGDSEFKRATAAVFYRGLNLLSDVPIPLDTGDFRLMDRCVVDVLRRMPESDRFVRGMVAWVGFKQVAVPYRRAARAAGTTKYPLTKMLRFAITGVLSFSSAPLRLATWLGFVTSLVSFLGILYAIYGKVVLQNTVPGWAATFVAVLFFSGVQLITIGIIGEYLARLYTQAKARPNYLVAERLGFTASSPSPIRE